MQGAGSPLPSCENPGTASEIVVVPARERLGKLDLPFILAIKKGAPLCLYGDIYCAAWYGNGVIVRILLATREYVVFNTEFENAGYHHAPFQVTFVARAKLFRLPPFRRGQQLMDQFVHNCGHGVSLGWKWYIWTLRRRYSMILTGISHTLKLCFMDNLLPWLEF